MKYKSDIVIIDTGVDKKSVMDDNNTFGFKM